jgi:hypothetical protein
MSKSSHEGGYRPPPPDKKKLKQELRRAQKRGIHLQTDIVPEKQLEEDLVLDHQPLLDKELSAPPPNPLAQPEITIFERPKKEQKKAKHAKGYSQQAFTRRAVIGMGATIGAGLILFSGAKIKEVLDQPTEADPGVPPTQKEIPSKKNKELVTTAARKLGVPPSAKEDALWRSTGYTFYSEKNFPSPEEKMREAQRRFGVMMVAMASSENTHFTAAAQTFFDNFQDVASQVTLNPTPLVQNEKIATASIGAVIDSTQRVRPQLHLSVDMAHEMEHVRNLLARLKDTNGSLTPDQQLQRERQLAASPETQLAEEVKGNTIEAQSYIEAVARGYPGSLSDEEVKAAAFVLAGSNPKSTEWQRKVNDYWSLN